jgi:hypothetical protein
MRPLAVVVVDVDGEHAFEVTPVEDQQPVEILGTHSPDEALGDRVRFRRSQRRPHDPDALATEEFVEGAGEDSVRCEPDPPLVSGRRAREPPSLTDLSEPSSRTPSMRLTRRRVTLLRG